MKTKFTKRMLSLILSVLMITTSLPLAALTAFAAQSTDKYNLIGEYLTAAVDSAFTKTGTVTWDENEKAAYFVGGSNGSSYLDLTTNSPFYNNSAVNASTGFTVSIDVKIASDSQEWGRIFDIGTGNSEYLFLNGGYANNPWNHARIAYKIDGNDECNAKPSDVNYFDTWHNYTVTADRDAGVKLYVDGVLVATTVNTNLSTFLDHLSTFQHFYLGSSVFNDPNFKGYMKNLRIYSSAIDPSNVQGAITMYENVMNGNVYTNMAAAYDAYITACKAYDAYVYGKDTTINLDAAASALNTAVGNMKVWSAYSGTAEGYFQGRTVSADYYSNILYTSTSSYWTGDGTGDVFSSYEGHLAWKLVLPTEITMLYNGNDAYFPVRAEIHWYDVDWRTEKKTRCIHYCSDNTTGLEFRSNWGGLSTDWQTFAQITSQSISYITGDLNHHSDPTKLDNESRFMDNKYYIAPNELSFNDYCMTINSVVVNRGSSGKTNEIEHTGTVTNNGSTICIIDYKSLIDAVKSSAVVSYITSVADYKENGLSELFTALDSATSYDPNNDFSSDNNGVNACTTNISNKVGAINNAVTTTPPAADANYNASYQKIRDLLDGVYTDADYNGTDKLGRNIQESLAADSSEYSEALYTAFTNAYNAAVNAMKDVYTNGYSTDVTAVANTLANTHKNLGAVSITPPDVTENKLLGPNDTITITKPDGVDSVTYKLGSNPTVETTDVTTTLTPFENGGNTITLSVESHKDGNTSTTVERTYTYYNGPAFNRSNEATVSASDTLAITDSEGGAISYSYDGTNWSNYSAPVTVFAGDNADKLVVTVYAKAVKGDATSDVSTISLVRNDMGIAIYSDTDGITSVSTYAKNSVFKIENTGSNAVYYTVSYDGGAPSAYTAYNANDGISANTAAFKDAYTVTIKAYAVNGGSTVIAQQTFTNKDFDRLVYRESFDDASFNGASFTTGSEKGVGGTLLKGAGNASVVSGAGDTHGWDGNEYNGSSSDWRENVLKFNATGAGSGNTNDNTLTLDTNPIANANDNVKNVMRSQGITISFWRHFEGTDGSRVSLGTKSEASNTCANWRNIMYFTQDQGNVTQGYNSAGKCSNYYLIEADGYNSYTKTAGSNYFDYVPNNQDFTSNAAGNDCGYWMNVVVTINPNGEIAVYNNGDRHTYTLNVSGSTKTGNDALAANNASNSSDLINYLLDGRTKLNFNFANGWDQNGNVNNYDMYLDDIRIYAGALSQVDINNMYNDEYSDSAKGSSTSHDPTNVTVYTLNAGTYTNNDGGTYTAPAGKTVGIEFIEYYNVDIKTQVSKIEYYSFGTGMTVYKSSDNIHWTVLGDRYGNCGYNNADLFMKANGDSQSYLEALAEPQAYVKQYAGNAVGAGYLVWAPHVMYNLQLNTWVYYAACSVWGTAASATFRAVSQDDTIEHYVYQGIVKRSPNTRPNVIDSCEFYGRKADGTIDASKIYMSYGAWAETGHPEKDIVICELKPDGTSYSDVAEPGRGDSTANYICSAIDWNGQGYYTGEGSYICYENGWYYLYVSYGENKGNYTERVFRSKNPKGPYVDYYNTDATDTTDTTPTSKRGQQVLNAFYSPVYGYVYTSTGHNSIYKAINNNGEAISLNACHARPYSNETTGWHAIEDVALTTRQLELTGNITLIYPVIYSQDGWPLFMPYQYNGTDTDKVEYTVEDIAGIYTAADLGDVLGFNWSDVFTYTILDNEDGTAKFYGSRPDGSGFNYTALVINEDGKSYINLYANDDTEFETVLFKGAFAKHTEKDKKGNDVDIVEFGIFDVNSGRQTWSYRSDKIPESDQVSAGDIIKNTGIIYTHEIDGNYTKYGREISDNFNYGKNNISSGERCTTFTTTYPYYVDVTNRAALYSISSERLVGETDEAGAVLEAVDIYGYWVDENGKKYSDKQAAAAYTDSKETLKLTKTYGIKGMVSSYFEYGKGEDGGYPQTGVTILINYLSKKSDDNNKYGEYKFFYVMPNPEWAHELIGIRNTNNFNGDKRTSNAVYSRFPDSEGYATNILSTMTEGMGCGLEIDANKNVSYVRDIGNFDYTSQWGDNTSLTADYSQPEKVGKKFHFFGQTEGMAAGSYAWVQHSNTTQSSYGISPAVVDVDYYIDYSDSSQYGNLINVNNSNVPTGYSFELRNSNVNWNPSANVWYIVSWYRNNTGLAATYNSTEQKDEIWNTQEAATFIDINYEKGGGKGAHGAEGVHGMLTNSGIPNGRAFTTYDNGWGDTGTWNGTVTFTGRDSLAKNTDRTKSAEEYSNYILASGITNTFTYSLINTGHSAEETYQYYNIGVSTCDKGAVRDFLEKYANKEMVQVFNSDGKMLYLEPGDGIMSNKYSVTSYNNYLKALAEAYFFLYNPHNTTYNGTGESAVAANSNTGEHEYVTAYRTQETTFTGYVVDEKTGEHKDYTVTRAANSPLYDSVDLGGGNNIFRDDTVNTDPVQTRLIDNVIAAYLDLFVVDDYTNVRDTINNIIENKENKEVQTDPDTGKLVVKDTTGYTPESVAEFEQAINLAKDYIQYYTGDINPDDRDNYWRYTDLTPEEYRQLQNFVEATDKALMPVVDKDELDTKTIPEKTVTVQDGIYEGAEQTYTMASWADVYKKLGAAQKASDACEENGVVVKPMYNYGDKQTANILDTEYTYCAPFEASENNYSEYQTNVNKTNADLKAAAPVPVDKADTYESFDAASEVVDTIDLKKYNPEARAEIEKYIAQFRDGADNGITVHDTTVSSVYASSDLIETYNSAATNADKIPAGTKLKNTPEGETDRFTTALLELTNTLNNNYINMYQAYLKIVDENNNAGEYNLNQEKKYGEMFAITEPSLEGKNVVWSVEVYGEGLEENYTATHQVSVYNGSTLMRKADADVKVTAVILPDDTVSSGYMVDIRNIYDKTIDVDYVSSADSVAINGTTLTVNGNTYNNPPIPFWTFNGWSKSVDEDTKIITVTPNYSVEYQYDFTALGGTVSKSTARYDTVVTVATNNNDFYAWAVMNGDKYQIVSYSKTYSFSACASEDYVVIVKNGDSYETVDNVTLTASNVENPLPNSFYNNGVLKEKFAGMTPDEFLNKKLDNKAPFVYIECKVLNQAENYGRVYVRVTEGAQGITGYGVNLVINGASYTRPVDNMLRTGQFTYTARKASGLNSLTFTGYVTYDFDYSGYHIAAIDETSVADVYAEF